jgi:hypothetical protein
MILTITCPFCLREGRTREEYLGREVRCTQCRQSFPVSSRVIGDAGRPRGESATRNELKSARV